jgi:outer membrane protein assembly factor BamB
VTLGAFVAALVLAACSGLELNRPFRPSAVDWTQAGGDGGRRHLSGEAPPLPWTRLWEYNAQAGMLAPPLVRDSVAIISTLNGEVQAIELRRGKRLGYQKVGGPVRGTPALNGAIVYLPISTTTRPSVIALDVREGRRRWEVSIGPVEASLLLDEGRLFAATLEGRVLCLDPGTGEERWRYLMGTKADRKPIRSSPALSGQVVVVGSDAGLVVGLDAATGQQRWSVRMSASIFAGASASGGTAVMADVLGRVVAIDAGTGSVRWTRELGSPIYAAASIDGTSCFVPTADGRLVALDLATGEERWTFRANGVVNASPLIAGDRLLVGSLDRSVAIVDRQRGTLVDRIEVGGRVKVTPILWQGIVLITHEDKTVAAYVHRESGR